MRSTDFFATHPVFTHDEYLAATGLGRTRSPRTVESLLAAYVAAGRIVRVRRGLYASVPPGEPLQAHQPDPFLIAGKLAPDAVVGYHAALQLRGKAYSVWHRYPVLLTGALQPFSYQGNEFVRVAYPKSLRARPDLGGCIVTEPCAGGTVRVTSLERTLVDVLHAPELGGGWEEIWRSLAMVEYFDFGTLLAYAAALGSALTCARLGFYLELHRERLFVEEWHLRELRQLAPKQPRYLDRTRETGRLIMPWNLVVPPRVIDSAWEYVPLAPERPCEGNTRDKLAAARKPTTAAGPKPTAKPANGGTPIGLLTGSKGLSTTSSSSA